MGNQQTRHGDARINRYPRGVPPVLRGKQRSLGTQEVNPVIGRQIPMLFQSDHEQKQSSGALSDSCGNKVDFTVQRNETVIKTVLLCHIWCHFDSLARPLGKATGAVHDIT